MENFYTIVREEECIESSVLIKHRIVRPVSGGKIVKTSEEGVTVKVKNGDVLRIGEYLYIWLGERKQFELQC